MRWYDPITSRFISKDPIGISGGLNQFVYADDNPVNFRDPFGLCKDDTYPSWTQGELDPWWAALLPWDGYDITTEPVRNLNNNNTIRFHNWARDTIPGYTPVQDFFNRPAVSSFFETHAFVAMSTQGGSMGGGAPAISRIKGPVRQAYRLVGKQSARLPRKFGGVGRGRAQSRATALSRLTLHTRMHSGT